MDKKGLGGRIKLARSLYSKKSGMKFTQQLLAEKIGISRSYMGDIESGRTYPTFIVLNSIAEACEVPLSFFSEEEEEENTHYNLYSDNQNFIFDNTSNTELSSKKSLTTINSISSCFEPAAQPVMDCKFTSIPVLGVIRAGSPIVAHENIISYEYIPAEMAKGGIFFGLKVAGDSMNNSRIFDGDIILVRHQDHVENGEIAVILVDEENATIKRFFKTDSIVTLMPDSSNKDHHPRFIDITKDSLKILGKVIKVIINME
ncbi:MAG: helix-turn-helix domain-containing protein [Clostridia bacterium]|nr:helix-turn-helix domain-containing protein [Clostridia bacterium]